MSNIHFAEIVDGWVVTTGANTLVPPGCIEITEPLPDNLYRYENGEFIRSEPPSLAHTRHPSGEWVLSTTLEVALANATALVNAWRDTAESQQFTFAFNGRLWDAGQETRARLQPVAGLSELPANFFWTDAENVDVPMTLAGVHGLSQAHDVALVERGFAIHANQRNLKATLPLLTIAELLAFTPGWLND